MAMWTAAHTFPLLPWSCVVLESVPETVAHRTKAIGA